MIKFFKQHKMKVLLFSALVVVILSIVLQLNIFASPGTTLSDGIYYWRVKAIDEKDSSSNFSDYRQFVVDTTPPTLTLNGFSEINLNLGENFIDEGAKAFDNIDGDITNKITVINRVNVNQVGIYFVIYQVSDNVGNSAEIERKVMVNALKSGTSLPPAAFNPPINPAPSPENPEGILKILINNNELKTISREVNLKLFGGLDTKNMAISNYSDFRESFQETYQENKNWILLDGFGEKIVYVKYFNNFGRASTIILDSIIYEKEQIITPEIPIPTLPVDMEIPAPVGTGIISDELLPPKNLRGSFVSEEELKAPSNLKVISGEEDLKAPINSKPSFEEDLKAPINLKFSTEEDLLPPEKLNSSYPNKKIGFWEYLKNIIKF